MTTTRRHDILWGLPVALALILAFWVLGAGGAARVAWLQLLGAAVIPLLVFRRLVPASQKTSTRTILLLSLAFVALAALSLVTSTNWGITAGAVATLAASVALMHAASLVPRRAAAMLVAAQVVFVAPIAVSAILEPLGGGWLAPHDYYPGRAMANMGGPGPLGALLAAVTPVAAAFFLASSKRTLSILSGVAVALMIAALTATFSRAALLATVVGFLTLVAVLVRASGFNTSGEHGLRFRRRVLRRALVVVAMAVLIVPVYNAIVRGHAPPDFAIGVRPGTQTFEFARQIEGTELTNVEVRVLCWGTALRTISRSPLTGVGAGCFGVASEGLIQDGLKRVAAARGFVYEFAYNDYLQMGAELGIPALAVFISLLAVILLSARSACRRQAGELLREPLRIAAGVGVVGALSALLAQAFVDFPLHLPSHQTLLWVNLGLLTALANPRVASATEPVVTRTPLRRLAAALAVLVAAAMATVGIRGILAERSAVEAVRLHELEDWEEALELASRSTVLAPHEHAYWVLLAEMANKAALAGVDLGRTLPMTFDAYRQAGRTYPDHAPTYGRAGALYLSHADAMPGAVDSAEVYLRRAIALNPYYADPHTNLGTVLMLVGDYEAARTELLRAGELDTASATPLFNLGNLESTLGNVSAAVMDYRTALEREPSHVGALINLSILLIADGQLSEAEEHLRAALHVDPGLGQAKALLSTIEEARR